MASRPPPDRRGGRRAAAERPSGPEAAPDLREAALAYLARFATTEAGLLRVLERRVARWARQAVRQGADPDAVGPIEEQAHREARLVAVDMVRLGAVDDASFAASRVRALSRGGRSSRAVAAHLAGRGVAAETVARAVEEARAEALLDPRDAELAAALIQARRRRIGPFAATEPDLAARTRALGALARAGFAHEVARRALDTDLRTAEALIARLRES